METFSALLGLCGGNSPVTDEFPSQRRVTRSFDVSLICAWTNGWVIHGQMRRRHHWRKLSSGDQLDKLNELLWPPPANLICIFSLSGTADEYGVTICLCWFVGNKISVYLKIRDLRRHRAHNDVIVMGRSATRGFVYHWLFCLLAVIIIYGVTKHHIHTYLCLIATVNHDVLIPSPVGVNINTYFYKIILSTHHLSFVSPAVVVVFAI